MSIPISSTQGKHIRDWLVVGVSCLAIAGSFGLGVLAGREQAAAKGPEDRMWVEQLPAEVRADPSRTATGAPTAAGNGVGEKVVEVAQSEQLTPERGSGTYVASRTGSKFYLPTCATAKRIKEENKVWFATREEAVAAGFEPAANCKGM